MTEMDLARQCAHNAEVKYVDDKNAFNIAYNSFLDGLKAGRPKWHKVADGDLPPERFEGKQILVVPQKHKFTEPMFVVGYYLLSEYRVGMEKKFYFDSDCRDEIDEPYAWKEIILSGLEEK